MSARVSRPGGGRLRVRSHLRLQSRQGAPHPDANRLPERGFTSDTSGCQTRLAVTETSSIEDKTRVPKAFDAIVESVKKTGKLLVVHEDTRTGGIAGEIAMRVSEKAFEWLDEVLGG